MAFNFLGNIEPTGDFIRVDALRVSTQSLYLQFYKFAGTWEEIVSFGLIRRCYFYDGQVMKEQCKRFSPTQDGLLLRWELNNDIVTTNAANLYLEVGKFYNLRTRSGSEPRWTVSIFEL